MSAKWDGLNFLSKDSNPRYKNYFFRTENSRKRCAEKIRATVRVGLSEVIFLKSVTQKNSLHISFHRKSLASFGVVGG